MNDKMPSRSTPMWPVYVGLALSLLVFAVFLVEFIGLSQSETDLEPVPETLTEETYMPIVSALLNDANPEDGERLIQQQGCSACHTGPAAENGLAPDFARIADRAVDRRPPLTAEAYLYESIVHPAAYEVEGYSAQMPQHYGQLSDNDLGDIIAYLLTLTAQ